MSKLSLIGVGLTIDGRTLVRDVSLDLQPQKLIAFVGPNGAGKTTLLRILARLIAPTEGRALLDNVDLQSFRRRDLARHIAFMPQDTHIDFSFTVAELVAMGRHAHLGRFAQLTSGDHRAITEAMKRADVVSLANRFVTELSAGERQRVLIARSLATEADIILLDEPVANLDISHALDVLDLCLELAAEGKLIGIAMHDLNAAGRYANDIVLIDQGRIVQSGLPSEVLTEELLSKIFEVSTERAATADGSKIFIFRRESQRVYKQQ